MKKISIQFFLLLCLGASTNNTMALTDEFYASGEDLDYLFDASNSFIIEDIESELRRFVFYRKLEDLLYDLGDEYPGISQ